MFKLFSFSRKRQTAQQQVPVAAAPYVMIGNWENDAGDQGISIEVWTEDRQHLLVIPFDHVDSVIARMRRAKECQAGWRAKEEHGSALARVGDKA